MTNTIQPPASLEIPAAPDGGYYYPQMPAGHRCGWSCRWTAGYVYPQGGSYAPGPGSKQYGPETWKGTVPEDMTLEQLRQELEDISAREGLGLTAAPAATGLLLNPRRPNWQFDAIQLLYAVRPQYREYVAPYNPPPSLSRLGQKLTWRGNLRPGWEIYEKGLAEREAERAKKAARLKQTAEELQKIDARLDVLTGRKEHATSRQQQAAIDDELELLWQKKSAILAG